MNRTKPLGANVLKEMHHKRRGLQQKSEQEVKNGTTITIVCIFLVLIGIAGVVANTGVNFAVTLLSLGDGSGVRRVLYGVFGLGVFLSFGIVFLLNIVRDHFIK